MTSAAAMGVPIYAKLVQSRISRGLTQRDLADHLEISVSHFNRIENGRKCASSDQLFEWAEKVGVLLTAERLP